MSILISDMEMPTGCSALTLKVWPDGQVEIIDAGGEWKTSEAAPIPEPHGRLIDADALYSHIKDEQRKCNDHYDGWSECQVALGFVNSAATIIPASGEVGSSK